ncbi:response regulator [Sulfitobacter sp. CW3]|uniref:response regulator n=1 Tax=Sulfitobacter sp. CW3 TaxID=2861965 RepID=UPI001C5E3B73|nr:response regulator [Sulfitobacter sp. CW3]MBW4963117.1 response regulator [Sulfitobacter sp. CW3]
MAQMHDGRGSDDDGTEILAPENKELKVLIVDDSSFDCKNIMRQFRRTSLRLSIDTASDLDQMRVALDTRKYDVIFVDYHLTHETGLQARQVISQHPENAQTATIMITGEASHEVAVSAIKNGCKDYVAKADLDAMSLEMMMKSATKKLEQHASKVLQSEMDAIHDRTIAAMSQLVQNELSDDRIVSLIVRALQHVTYVDGFPVLQQTPEITTSAESEKLDYFDFGELADQGI